MQILPGVRQGTEYDHIVGPGTRVSARLVIVRVAIRAWASVLEEERERRRLTRVGRRVCAAAAILRVAERFARAPARHTPPRPVPSRHLQLRRTRAVQFHQAAGGAAPAALPAPGHHEHGEVVPVHQADVVEVQAAGAVQGELGEGGRRLGAGAGALHLPGAAVARDAGEPALGVPAAEGPAPDPTRPGPGQGDGPGSAAGEGEAGGGELGRVGAGEQAGPDRAAALVDDLEGSRVHFCERAKNRSNCTRNQEKGREESAQRCEGSEKDSSLLSVRTCFYLTEERGRGDRGRGWRRGGRDPLESFLRAQRLQIFGVGRR